MSLEEICEGDGKWQWDYGLSPNPQCAMRRSKTSCRAAKFAERPPPRGHGTVMQITNQRAGETPELSRIDNCFLFQILPPLRSRNCSCLESQEFSRQSKFLYDVKSANKFRINVNLRVRGPLAVSLEPLANFFVF